MVPKLSNSLKAHVSEALSQPIHTNIPRLLARKYIGMYEKIELCNDLLLKYAKLDFNILQKLHQGELGELTRWWKNLDFAKKFPYARDRMVECYFWVAGVYIEPQHGRARKMMTKLLTTYVIIDDTYDAYATYDELVAFTNAIDRCDDISAINSVSPNLRPVYQALLDRYDEIEEELTKEDKLECIYYAKQEMKKVARAYLKEALWLNDVYIPKCEEYMKVAIVSTTVIMAATTFLCVMEENITKETFEWVINEPLILRASSVIGRLKDDINTNDFEQQRSHVASFIECYMKEYGISKQEAYVEARKKLTNAWKDINEEFLTPSEVPLFVLEQEISSQEKHEHEELKEKVKKMLVETPDNSIQKLVLIDTIQRLGVEYHFKKDIEISIQNIFEESQENENDDDLYVVALRFRLVRQQRHYMSSDVFKKFINHEGKFKETLTKDVQGLLSLYEAAHLRVHGEEILEEALTFTITHLESMGPKLGNSVKAQVSEALNQPIHTNLPRLLARKHICMYENIESRNDLLLKFAKMDFNILQKLYQRELNELTRWWNDMEVANKISYGRDRLVESYFGAVGVHFEPQQSRTRIIIGKTIAIINIVDDTYDAYATFDELVLFTNAIERYDDISVMESVPPNLRPVYRVLIEFLNEIEQE
ncbi:hypothetical protein KY285_037226 [Solanum tuberosum]|nr:hypothetical protein KY285_037226 [Solanum tuberosum]